MARLACTLEDRPLPDADSAVVLALLPSSVAAAIVATDDQGTPAGAAWWHFHDPSLVRDGDGNPLPEMAMAVLASKRDRGIGTALVEALASHAANDYSALSCNVHLRNPAARLYTRLGFHVAGKGRGVFGVALTRSLRCG